MYLHQLSKTPHLSPHERESQISLTSNDDFYYMHWTDEDLLSLMISDFPQIYEIWYEIRGIQRSDLGRYAVLYKYGGFYADTDFYTFSSLRDIIDEKETYFAPSIKITPFHKNTMTNYIMYTPPNNPIFLELINEGVKRIKEGYTDVPYTTGRRLIIDVCKDKDVKVFDEKLIFNQFCYNCEEEKGIVGVHRGGTTEGRKGWRGSLINNLIRKECEMRELLGFDLRNSQVPYIFIFICLVVIFGIIYLIYKINF